MILYKYTGGAFASNVLTELRLKITPPREFNDPFELTPRSLFTDTAERMQEKIRSDPAFCRALYEQLKSKGLKVEYEAFRTKLCNGIPAMFGAYRKQMLRRLPEQDLKQIEVASEQIGILCLSKLKNSIPMWAYYAHSHTGLAYGIDAMHRSLQLEEPDHFGSVRYRKHRLQTDPSLTAGTRRWYQQIRRVMFTKAHIWKHESEYRRIYQLSTASKETVGRKALYFVPIDPEVIREIVFGCNVDPTLENKIRGEMQKFSYLRHIQLLRCSRHLKMFKLKVSRA